LLLLLNYRINTATTPPLWVTCFANVPFLVAFKTRKVFAHTSTPVMVPGAPSTLVPLLLVSITAATIATSTAITLFLVRVVIGLGRIGLLFLF